jgi:hypothetical protein
MEQIMRIWTQTATAVGALLLSAGVAAAATAVAENDLNMRTGPGTEYSVVNVIPDGAPVDVRGCDAGWCQVAYAGTAGYASQNYLGLAGAGEGYAAPTPYLSSDYPDYSDYYDDDPDALYDYGPGIGFGVGIGGYRQGWHGQGGHHRAGGWTGGHAWNGAGRTHIGGGNVGAAHVGGGRLGGAHMGGGHMGGGSHMGGGARMGGGAHMGGGHMGGGMHMGGGHAGGGHMAHR